MARCLEHGCRASEAEQASHFRAIIVEEWRVRQLPEDAQRIRDVWQACPA